MAVNQKKGSDEEPEQAFGLLKAPKEGTELFEGNAKTMTVTKDVNPGQLMEEVYERLGDRKKFEVVAQVEDDEGEISEENPLVLHVFGDADMRTVRGVVESHEKDPNYGVSDDERELRELADRLTSGEDLPAADLNKLLRGMLQR